MQFKFSLPSLQILGKTLGAVQQDNLHGHLFMDYTSHEHSSLHDSHFVVCLSTQNKSSHEL